MNIGTTWANRACAAVGLAMVATFALSGVALADDIANNVDATLDATAETMPLTAGGPNGSTTLRVIANGSGSNPSDGKSGCNLTGSTTLVIALASSDPAVATASLSNDTFTSCSDTKTVTVRPLSAGSTTITVSQVSNNTGGTFDFAPATFTVNVAPQAPTNTPPVVSVTGVANNATYEAGAVPTAGCAVVDAEDTGESATPVTTAGATNHHGLGTFTTTCTYTDNGPGTRLTRDASASYTVADTTRPVITFVSRSQPAGPWTNQSVNLAWSCTDGTGSGVNNSASTLSATVSIEGENQTSTGTCIDNAGNTATNTVTNIDIDKTNPAISLSSRSHTAGTWTNQDVNLIWTCTDNTGGSGVNASASTLSATVANDGSNQTTGVCVDNAGNRATNDQTDIDIDKTDPVITFVSRSQPAGTWTNQDVDVVWSCTDGTGSGVNNSASTLSATISTEGENQESTGTCIDNAGNTATHTVTNIDIDKTDPVITFVSRSQLAGAWTNQNVDLVWSCTDTDGSGVNDAASELSKTVSTEGENQTSTGTCVDNAGNTATDEITDIAIDKTDPVITFVSRSQPSGAWTNQSVDLVWSCTDGTGSGVNNSASTLTDSVTTDGENQTSTGTCVDNAGNDATDTQRNIDIDKTDPVITFVSRSQPIGPWTNQSVILAWSCTDESGSGVNNSASELSKTVSAEGENQTSTGTCVDNAGNTASDKVTDIDIDKTKPVVSSDVSAAGTKGNGDWYTSPVEVTFTANDALSGPASATQKVTSSGDGTAVEVSSPAFTDNAGNTTAAGAVKKTYKVDTVAPSVADPVLSGTEGVNGWYRSAVTASFTAHDDTSGLAGTNPQTVTSTQQGTGIVLSSPAFSDVAGNTRAAGAKSATVKVDSVSPSVSLLNGPGAGSTYYFGSVPDAPTCGASDGTSGLAAPCTVTGYDTSVGTHTVQATATDNAGNRTTVGRTYTVGAWTTKGFYSPVDMNGIYNVVKGGSTVPLKFELFAGTTELTDVAAVGSFTASKITCGTDVALDTVEVTSTGGTSLRYDATGGQFIQNWKTPTGAGTCYKTTMTADDGSAISALFKIK